MKLKEFYTDKSKWTQDEFYNGRGAYCLLRALQKCYPVALGDGVEGKEKRLEVEDKIRKAILEKNIKRGRFGDSIIGWNDAPERTFEEVKALVEELDV